ncbi:MHS family MFS transporter [Acinetobacter sp. B5B]|uniref:MFS transporter n=1 Tax=Acinetobacter baretiae TaxID=2605383 RepID=UPI0018C34A40|nr:MFS transporter [Acinetobacter baretiae]MBF7683115.1 MHS family MFS transporter [Acinetobacter baretiae]MBF7684509.1 MHS family MFS transporter [Acinetobacter baretiae]
MESASTMSENTPPNSKARVLLASLVGTTIEFFDFYIYATAAVLVFPHLFFPASSGGAATLQSLAVFAVAFIARPVGAAVFGHLGDRIGRKSTLVAALLLMGISTVCIGLLPTYAQIGILAPICLVLCRFGQGLGLGGEWSGAVLLATENAPEGKRAWYGMFPQLGAPIGFILAAGSFLLLGAVMSNENFLQWGWRIPFIASSLLVFVGLYIRLKLHETPAFKRVLNKQKEANIPFKEVFSKHSLTLLIGTLSAICTFVLFYMMTVFALNWGTSALGYARGDFLKMQLFATLFFAAFIPISALLAEKIGRKTTSASICVITALFGLSFPYLFVANSPVSITLFLCIGLAIMGSTYGPIGTVLSEIFPTSVRYTGSALAFNLAGILGASFAPLIASDLAKNYGIYAVGYYLIAASAISFIAFLFMRETKNIDVNNQI